MTESAAAPFGRRRFTDAEVARWADEELLGDGYAGEHLGPAIPGPPPLLGPHARTLIEILGLERAARLARVAQSRGVTVDDLLIQIVDAIPE